MSRPTDDSRTAQAPRVGKAGNAGIAFAAVVGFALFFAVISPFNAVTYLPFWARWPYWAFLIGITWLTQSLCLRLAPQRYYRWLVALITSIVATPLVLVSILLIQSAIGHPVPGRFWLSLAGSIWVINLALTFLRVGLVRPHISDAPQPQAQTPGVDQPLRDRLPLAVRSEAVLALTAQDHYVTVLLPSGEHMIHMRFGDAVAMMAGADGLRVHRSWWVAKASVREIRRNGRQWEVELINSQVAPVSRAGANRLKEAGWH